MKSIESRLLHLITNLSHIKEKECLINLYLEGIESIFDGFNFLWISKPLATKSFVKEITIREATYGYIEYDQKFEKNEENYSIFQQSVKLLALLIEHLEQASIIKVQHSTFQQTIKTQTPYSIDQQDGFSVQDEEYTGINEKLIETNKSLTKLNEQLELEIEERKKFEEALAESETLFRNLANNGQALIWTSGIDKKCNYFNRIWLEFTGRELEQELGDGWVTGVHPDDLERCIEIYVSAFDKREKFSMEYRLKHVTGNYHWIIDNGTPIYNSKGEFIGYIGHCLDINEHKEIEITLRETDQRYHKAEKIASVGNWFYDCQTTRFWGSDGAKKIYGFAPEAENFSTEEIETCIPERERVHQALIDLIETGKEYNLEFEIYPKNSIDPKIILSIAELEKDDNDKPLRVTGVILDITKRKLVEKELQKSERWFRSFVENANDIVFALSFEGNFTYVSPKWTELLGHKTEEVVGRYFGNFIHPDDFPACLQVFEKASTIGEKHSGIEYRALHKDGTWRWHITNTSTIRNEKNEIISLIGIGRDITERKQFEITLKNSEERLSITMELTQTAIWDWDLENDKWYASPLYYSMLGYDPIEGESVRKVWLERIHPEDRENVIKKIKDILSGAELEYIYEARMLHKNGTYRWHYVQGYVAAFNKEGKAIRMLGTRIDITERKQSEEMLHRLNRELKAISNCNQLLMRVSDEQTLLDEVCRIICDEAGYFFTWVGYAENDKEKTVRPISWAGQENGYLSNVKISWSEKSPFGQGPTGKAIREGKYRCIQNSETDPNYSTWREMARKHGYRSSIALPLKEEDEKVFGAINIYSKESNAFTENEIRLLDELAGDLAYGINSIRTHDKRKTAETLLYESETKFRKIYEDGPLGMALANSEFGFIMANNTFCQMLGYSEEELLKMKIHHISHPDYLQHDSENILKIIKGQLSIYKTEKRYYRKDGQIIWGALTVTGHFSEKGKFLYIVCMVEDITERKRVVELLKESEEKYRSFYQNSMDAILLTKPDGTILSANQAACSMLGRKEEEIIRLGRDGIIDTTDERLQGFLEERMRNGKVHCEMNFKRKDGSLFPADITSALFQISNGELRTSIIIRDITKQKKDEEELRKLWRALEQSPDSIIISDRNGKIEYANPAILKLSGYTIDEIVGKNQRIFGSGNMSKDEYINLWDTICTGKIWQGEFLNKKKEGELFWQSATISPIFDQTGAITHFLAISEDITEQKKLTLELIKAKDKAEESDRLKSSFLANMSHEIRTPMNSIMGFASLLPEEDSHELISQYAQIIVRNSEQLVHIIDDIVLYSRLQTRLLSLFPSSFKAKTLFNDIKQSFNLPEFKNEIELVIEADFDENIEINSDYEKVRQVITNLVSNAFKYTKKGFVSIGINKMEQKILFTVKDTGIGIPKMEQEKIFDRFYRASNVDKGIISGTGLGLSIVKELVELLGGEIWVKSKLGEGSCFYFTISTI